MNTCSSAHAPSSRASRACERTSRSMAWRMSTAEYRSQSAAETLTLIADGVDPWRAIGQFVDDWRRTPAAQRPLLCEAPLTPPAEHARWAALMAAAVEWLCAQDGLSFPDW